MTARIGARAARALARAVRFLFAGARECGSPYYLVIPLWKDTHRGRVAPGTLREPPAAHPERLVPDAVPDPVEARLWADLDGVWRRVG